MTPELFGGFARTDITPDIDILMMGYPDPNWKTGTIIFQKPFAISISIRCYEFLSQKLNL